MTRVIRKGSHIYRGSSVEARFAQPGGSPSFLRNLPVYFTNKNNNAETYGRIVKYEVIDTIHLLDMSNPMVIRDLISLARSTNVKTAIKKAFRVANNKVGRFSRIKYDIHVAQFICKLGYDGYYAPELKNAKMSEGKFHSEIVLCHPKRVLRVSSVYNALAAPSNKRGVNASIMNAVRRTNYGILSRE